nr:hypothetical protein [Tanacetum cinerariifolium]
MNQKREHEALLAAQREQELLSQEQAAQEKEEPPQNFDFRQLIGEIIEDLIGRAMNTMLLSINLKSQRLDKEKQEVKNIVEKATKRRTHITESLQNFRIIHKKSSISLNNTSQISLVITNTPDLPTKEPEYSLSMGDEHLSIIPKIESNKVIKSSVENLVPIPKPLLNQDILTISYPKIDYFLELFFSELAHINPIPPEIKEADFDLEEEIHLVENLLYDNSSPRLPKELNAEIANTVVESLSPFPIPVEDNDSHMEEIDLFLATDDLMPSGIEYDDYDSEGDIYFIEELLSNDPLPLPENKSSNFDHHDDPSFPRPPPEPPDVEVFFDFEPDTGVLTAKVVEDISKHYVLMPKVLPSQPALCPNIDTLLPFSSKNKDKVTDIEQKDKNKAKPDKTDQGNGKSAKNQSRRQIHTKSNPINPLTLKKTKNNFTFSPKPIHLYWASVLAIPMGIVEDIQQLICSFLWCNGEYKYGKSKVAWKDIRLPKREGGLGLRSLVTFLWYDMLSSHYLLSQFLSPRDILNEGYSIKLCVTDLVVDGAWNWPQSWLIKDPTLGLIPALSLVTTRHNTMKWYDANGNMIDFSVKRAWEAMRPRRNEVIWFHTVWFSHAIPCHTFHLWLIIRRSLKTQDKLRHYDVDPSINLTQIHCSLCGTQSNSHEHLFFECTYSSNVWSLVRGLTGMDLVQPVLEDIMEWFQYLGNKRTICNVMGKLLFTASHI